ncbi:hypothetical protein MANES_03G083316v8 [Manihot esculenta]|uniref:Uncharacterized protein n=1 Tax=Manihot esculenta TaxID=3983 RepID=A0ACB7HZZ7_MANES|nr:hypothetical protein MANES_03G083316v8 [Manihot esculenta]
MPSNEAIYFFISLYSFSKYTLEISYVKGDDTSGLTSGADMSNGFVHSDSITLKGVDVCSTNLDPSLPLTIIRFSSEELDGYSYHFHNEKLSFYKYFHQTAVYFRVSQFLIQYLFLLLQKLFDNQQLIMVYLPNAASSELFPQLFVYKNYRSFLLSCRSGKIPSNILT